MFWWVARCCVKNNPKGFLSITPRTTFDILSIGRGGGCDDPTSHRGPWVVVSTGVQTKRKPLPCGRGFVAAARGLRVGSATDSGSCERSGHDARELARALGRLRLVLTVVALAEAAWELPDGRQVIAVARIHHYWDTRDGTDPSFVQVTVVVTHGPVLFAFDQVEPASEGAAQHQGPFARGQADGVGVRGCQALGARLDVLAGSVHPVQVVVTVGGLAVVDAVGAVDLVELAVPAVAEDLVPAHAVASTDGLGRRVHAVGLGVTVHLDRTVEGVRVVPVGQLADAGAGHKDLLDKCQDLVPGNNRRYHKIDLLSM